MDVRRHPMPVRRQLNVEQEIVEAFEQSGQITDTS